MLEILARNWWALTLRGVFAVLFGVAAFAWPGLTLGVLVMLFGAYALVDGAFAIAAVVVGRTGPLRPWWALLIEGIVGLGIGVVTFVWPGITAMALLFLIAAWSIVTGVFEILAAIELRKAIRGEWLLVVSGVLSIAFGVLLVVMPGAGALAVVWLIGAYAVAFGVLLIVLSFRLRGFARQASAGPA